MVINEDLKLVLPVQYDDKGVTMYSYHTPISKEVFEANYRILGATKADIESKGIHYQMGSGPRIAALALKDADRKDSLERGNVDEKGNPILTASTALLEEIKRLTMILAPGPKGWDMVPVDVLLKNGKLDIEEWQELEASLVFFTCHCSMAKKSNRRQASIATASVLGGLSTSLSAMDYAASLQTPTEQKNTMAESSVPS